MSASDPETVSDGISAGGNQTATRRRFPVLVLLPLVVFGVLAILFLYQLTLGEDPQRIPSALIDKPAPEFELTSVEGITREGTQVPGFSRADLIGNVSVVNVFASWCVPCRQEHPQMELLGKIDDIQLLGINYKDKPENARRFLGTLGNPYTHIGKDEAGRAAIDWGVYGVPETFIVDREGMIRYKFIGPISEAAYTQEFLPELNKILKGQ